MLEWWNHDMDTDFFLLELTSSPRGALKRSISKRQLSNLFQSWKMLLIGIRFNIFLLYGDFRGDVACTFLTSRVGRVNDICVLLWREMKCVPVKTVVGVSLEKINGRFGGIDWVFALTSQLGILPRCTAISEIHKCEHRMDRDRSAWLR